jgi:ATP-dependent Lon protease
VSEESNITLNVDDLSKTTPVLPLRDVVVYPHIVIPLFVGRERSISALDQAMQAGKQILLVAQKEADVDEPGADDIYRLGTLATILQLLKLPDGTVKVLVEGGERARIDSLHLEEHFSARTTLLPETDTYDEREVDVLTRSAQILAEQVDIKRAADDLFGLEPVRFVGAMLILLAQFLGPLVPSCCGRAENLFDVIKEVVSRTVQPVKQPE